MKVGNNDAAGSFLRQPLRRIFDNFGVRTVESWAKCFSFSFRTLFQNECIFFSFVFVRQLQSSNVPTTRFDRIRNKEVLPKAAQTAVEGPMLCCCLVDPGCCLHSAQHQSAKRFGKAPVAVGCDGTLLVTRRSAQDPQHSPTRPTECTS